MPTLHNSRISYIHGPGDVFGTYLQWKDGRNDETIIKETYSGQFYNLIKHHEYIGQVISITEIGDSQDDKFTFSKVSRNKKGVGLKCFFNEFKYALDIRKAISILNPNIIIISSDFPLLFLTLLPKNTKKILSIHNTIWAAYNEPNKFKFKVKKYLLKIALRSVNAAVCVSHECERQVLNLMSPVSIPTFVQIPRITINVKNNAASNKVKKILYVGRIEENKGIFTLLDAFIILATKYNFLTLEYVGDGSAMEQLKQSVPIELKDRIFIKGRLNANMVGESYISSDLVICPTLESFNEGLATVPIEAAYYNIPTICSTAVPAREYFSNKNLVYPSGNAKELSKKIDFLIRSNEDYKKAIKDCESALQIISAKTDSWYNQMQKCLDLL